MWILICDPCPNFTLFIYYLNRNWWMSGYSSESNYKSKVKEKQADAAYDWYKFSLCGMHKLVQVRNWCRNVWIMSLSYTYIIVSGSFLFSGFNRFPHFIPPTTVYKFQLNKVLRVQPFLFRVPLPPGGPRRQAERGDGPGSHWGVLMGG